MLSCARQQFWHGCGDAAAAFGPNRRPESPTQVRIEDVVTRDGIHLRLLALLWRECCALCHLGKSGLRQGGKTAGRGPVYSVLCESDHGFSAMYGRHLQPSQEVPCWLDLLLCPDPAATVSVLPRTRCTLQSTCRQPLEQSAYTQLNECARMPSSSARCPDPSFPFWNQNPQSPRVHFIAQGVPASACLCC